MCQPCTRLVSGEWLSGRRRISPSRWNSATDGRPNNRLEAQIISYILNRSKSEPPCGSKQSRRLNTLTRKAQLKGNVVLGLIDPNVGQTPSVPLRKRECALALARLLPVPRTNRRKPTLSDLAQLIRDTHAPVLEFGERARFMAAMSIRGAVTCGGYLREAKASEEMQRGQFMRWLKKECNIEPRCARNYMRLHIWVCSHQKEILEAKPHSLRQFYILAGILPEDESKKLPKANNDDLAKLRLLVRKVTAEAAAHRDYAEVDRLWQALEPLAPLLREVSTDLTEKGKHVSARHAD